MTDRQLESRLMAWYAAEVPESETAPAALRESITAIPASTPTLLHPLRRRRNFTLLGVAAVLAVGGALAAGSGAVRLTAVVPPVPSQAAALVGPPPSASPTIEPSASESPTAPRSAAPTDSAAKTPWMTGRDLMDALSAAYGYRWSPAPPACISTDVIAFWSAVGDPGNDCSGAWKRIEVDPPYDGPAKVHVGADRDAVVEAGLHAVRVAQALAPDAAPWIQEAITQVVSGEGSFATTTLPTSVSRSKEMVTATGGQVSVTFDDEDVIRDSIDVSFLPDLPPSPRLEPSGSGVVLYIDAGEIWAVNPDGTDPHLLVDAAGPVWWSVDGSRLVYNDGGSVFAIDSDASSPVRIGNRRDNPRCPVVVADDTCEAHEDIAVSPDGSRLAYTIVEGRDLDISTIAILDVATGAITRLASTQTRDLGIDGPCAGGTEDPDWSPDGTRLVFVSSAGPKVDGRCQAGLFTIRADGSEQRRFAIPEAEGVGHPRWSPDGSSILFNLEWLGDGPDAFARGPQVFVIGSDGADVRALTSDGRSSEPHWTRDGRIVFIRWEAGPAGVAAKIGRGDVRIMDADGQRASTLDTSVPAQTAAGCLVCPYLDEQGFLVSMGHDDVNYRFWQPVPARQP